MPLPAKPSRGPTCGCVFLSAWWCFTSGSGVLKYKVKEQKLYSVALLNSSTIRIGHTGMEIQHIIENILTVSEMLSEKLPEVQYAECMSLLSILNRQSV